MRLFYITHFLSRAMKILIFYRIIRIFDRVIRFVPVFAAQLLIFWPILTIAKFGFIFAVVILRQMKSVVSYWIDMKNLLLLVSCTLFFLTAQAQNTRPPMEDMVNAIKNNRVEDMVKYFDNIVPITINNTQSIYSKNQAEVVLKDFFEKNIPKDFLVMDNGSPNNSSKFIIGSLVTPSGTKYNVYILMKLKNSDYMLQEIKMNKE